MFECESSAVCVHCSADSDAVLSSQLPVDGTVSDMIKWPASTAEVATLPVCCIYGIRVEHYK